MRLQMKIIKYFSLRSLSLLVVMGSVASNERTSSKGWQSAADKGFAEVKCFYLN